MSIDFHNSGYAISESTCNDEIALDEIFEAVLLPICVHMSPGSC